MRGCQIDLTGDLARLPSTSNCMRWAGDHGLIKAQEHRDKFEVMSALYLAKTNMHTTPRFFNMPVFVIIANGKRPTNHIWDSHNVIKGCADWLQSIKLFDNDKDAEIWALKKEDYPARFPRIETTSILVVRKNLIGSLLSETFSEISNVANGSLRLIG